MSTFLARHNHPTAVKRDNVGAAVEHTRDEWTALQQKFTGEFTNVQARGELGSRFELLFSFLCGRAEDVTPFMDALQARFADEAMQAGYVFQIEKSLKTNYLVVYMKRA
jgi:hypothetical protein